MMLHNWPGSTCAVRMRYCGVSAPAAEAINVRSGGIRVVRRRRRATMTCRVPAILRGRPRTLSVARRRPPKITCAPSV